MVMVQLVRHSGRREAAVRNPEKQLLAGIPPRVDFVLPCIVGSIAFFSLFAES